MADDCPAGRCFLHWRRDPHVGGRDADIIDTRTGRSYCHEDALALLSWELDGRPEPDEHPDLVAALEGAS